MGKCFSRNKGKDGDGKSESNAASPARGFKTHRKASDAEENAVKGARDVDLDAKADVTTEQLLKKVSEGNCGESGALHFKATDISGKTSVGSFAKSQLGSGDADNTVRDSRAVEVAEVIITDAAGEHLPGKKLSRTAASVPLQPAAPVSAAPYFRRIEFAREYVGLEATLPAPRTGDAQQQQQTVTRSSSSGSGARTRAALNAWSLPEQLQSMYVWVCACGPDTELERQALQEAFYGNTSDSNGGTTAGVARHIREQFGLDPCFIDWRLGVPTGEYEQVYRRTALPFLHELSQWKDHVVVIIFDSQRYSPLFDDEVRFVLDHFNQPQLFMIQRIFFNPPSAHKPVQQRTAAEQLYFMFANGSGSSNNNSSNTNLSTSSGNSGVDVVEQPQQASKTSLSAATPVLHQSSSSAVSDAHTAHGQLSDDLSRVITIERQHVYRLKFDPSALPSFGDEFVRPLLVACQKMTEKSAQHVLDTVDEQQQARNYSTISRRIYAHVFTHWYRMKTLLLSRIGRAHIIQNADDGFQHCLVMMHVKAYLLSTSPLMPLMPSTVTASSANTQPSSSTSTLQRNDSNSTVITTARRLSSSPSKNSMQNLLASSTASIAAGTAGLVGSSSTSVSSGFKPLLVIPEKLLNLTPDAVDATPSRQQQQSLLLQSSQLALEKRLCSLLLAETIQLQKFLLLPGGVADNNNPNDAEGARIVFRFRFNHRESLLELLWSVIEQLVTAYKLSNKVSVDIFLNLLLRQKTTTDNINSNMDNATDSSYWPVRNALQEVLNQIALQLDNFATTPGASAATLVNVTASNASIVGDSSNAVVGDDDAGEAAARSGRPLVIILDNVPLSVLAGIRLNSSRIRLLISPPLYAALNEQHVHYDERFFSITGGGAGSSSLLILQQYFHVLPISLQNMGGGSESLASSSLLLAAPSFSSSSSHNNLDGKNNLNASTASLWSLQSISLQAAGALPREAFVEALYNVYGLQVQSSSAKDVPTQLLAKAMLSMQTPKKTSNFSKTTLRQLVLSSFASRLTLTLTLQELQSIVHERYHKHQQHSGEAGGGGFVDEQGWRHVNQLLLDTLQQLDEQGFIVYTLSTWRDQLVYLLTDWAYDLLRRQQVILPDAVDLQQQQQHRKSSSTSKQSSSSFDIVRTATTLHHRHKLTEVETRILAEFAASIDRPNSNYAAVKSAGTTTGNVIIQLMQRLALECSSANVKQRGLSATLVSNDSQLTVHFSMLAIEALVNISQHTAMAARRHQQQQQQQQKQRKNSGANFLLASPTNADVGGVSAGDMPICLQNDEKLFLSAICCSLPTLASEPAQLAVQLYHRLNKLRIADDVQAASLNNNSSKTVCKISNNDKNNNGLLATLLAELEAGNYERLALPYLSLYDCLLDPGVFYQNDAAAGAAAAGGGKRKNDATLNSYSRRKFSIANSAAAGQSLSQQQQLEFIKPSMIRCIPASDNNTDDEAGVCRDLVLVMNEEKGCVAVYDYRRNEVVRQIYGIDRPKDVKFLDSDRCVILSNREMKIYSLKQGLQVGHLKGVMNQSLPYFAVQNDKNIVALSRNRMYVNMFDVDSGTAKTTFKAGEDRFLNSLIVSRNGDKMVCGDETQKPFPLLVWDLNERKLIYDLRMANHEFLTQLMAIDDQGHFFACVCEEVNGPEPNFVVVYDIQHGTLYKKWKPGAPTTALAIASATKRVVVAAQNCGLYIYDLLAGSCKHVLFMHNYPATNLRVSDNGRRAVTWSARENCLRLWDIMSGQYLGGFSPDEEISCAEINNDGTFIIFACQMYVSVCSSSSMTNSGDAALSQGHAACIAVSTTKLNNNVDHKPLAGEPLCQYGTGEKLIDLRATAHKQIMEHGTESAV